MDRDVRLVIAWRGEPCPRLFSFNHDGYGAIHEFGEGEGVPLGSVGPMQRGITQKLFPKLFSIESNSGYMAYLAAALGVLQSLGIHDYLLKDGVGGSFTGLCVNRDSITWQPDLLYMIDEHIGNLRPCVSTCVRDGKLIVDSTITNEPRVFSTNVNDKDDTTQWIAKWGLFAQSFILKKQFDFVILLGLKRRVVIVIEMRGNTESEMLKFIEDSEAEDKTTWYYLHPTLIDLLNREFNNSDPEVLDFRFGFVPYEPLE